jgi:DNA repair protein RadA/Sms
LAVVAAILSSNEDIAVNKDFCFVAVGLSGEIRPVNRVNQRIQEAEKLGFSTILFLNTIKLPEECIP